VCDVGFCLEPERSMYVGGGDGRNAIARAAVADADRVVAVCRADPTGIKNFLWSFEQLVELAERDDILIVANRVQPSEQREVGELIRRNLGKRPIAYVPDRPAELSAAARAGAAVRNLFPGSDVCSALRSLAAAAGGRPAPRGVLAKLGGGRR
jgi:MinD-like ATPase involved in chromosome partitioning or flagellar assembly